MNWVNKVCAVVAVKINILSLLYFRTEYCLAGVVPGMEPLIPKKEESFAAAKAAAEARARAI